MPQDASTAVADVSFMDAAIYLLYGFGVVMITLTVLWFATAMISKILKAMGLDKMPAPKQIVKSAAAAVIPDETIAVITAAVSFATGGTAKIKSIHRKN